MESLSKYFSARLPHIQIEPLVEAFQTYKSLKKNEKLIQPGQNASYLAFIQKGTFRVYFYNESGIEITTWFSFAGMMVTDLLAFYKEAPASFYVEAIEDSAIAIIYKTQLELLYQQYPEYQQFGRGFAERGMVKLMERMLSLQTKTAEMRYKELLQKPVFMQKIPLKYLATYLGITDTSLSRIRKQVSEE